MKKQILICVSLLTIFSGVAVAEKVHDWKDLAKVHRQIEEAIREMGEARVANHYDMDGHGAKAEQLLRDAEQELHQAIESAKRTK